MSRSTNTRSRAAPAAPKRKRAARAPSGSNAAAAHLRDAIVAGRFSPNERLVEQELVTMLRTNRANVRSALARLEQEGLVVTERNRGARVRLVSDAEAIEITEVRGALEGLVARMAAERANAADKASLKAILAEMRAAFEAGDLMAYSTINGRLHDEIQRIGGNSTARRILETLESQIVRFQFRTILLAGRAAQSMKEHVEIVSAISAGDAERADTVMRRHLDHILAALRTAIASHG